MNRWMCGWVKWSEVKWSEVKTTALPTVGHRIFTHCSTSTQQTAGWPQTWCTWRHIKSPITSPSNPWLLGTYGERSCTVETPRYKPQGRGFNYISCHWWHKPSGRTMIWWPTQTLTEMSTSNISWGGGKGGRCVGLTILPPSCADCLEIWHPQGLSRPVMGLRFFY